MRDNSQSLHSLDSYTIRRRRSPSGRRAAVLAARYRPFACLPFNAATSSVAATSKCRPLVVLQTYPSPCDSLLRLHFCALREVIKALCDIYSFDSVHPPTSFWPGGAARHNQLSRTINNIPFQGSDVRNSPLRRSSVARVEPMDLFKFWLVHTAFFLLG